LRTPAAFRQGKVLARRRIVFVMDNKRDYSALEKKGYEVTNMLKSALVVNVASAATAAIATYTGGTLTLLASTIGLDVPGLIAGMFGGQKGVSAPERWKAIMAAEYIAAATYEMVLEVEGQ
jgi:hypothetical protein